MGILRVYWQTARHVNQRGYIYVWANMLWALMSLPIITAPAAWAGLVHLSHVAQTQQQVSMSDFWDGFRASFWRGLVVGFVTLIVLAVNLTNLVVYAPGEGVGAFTLRVVWISAVIVWLSILLYLWPLLEEMETPTLLGGLRNAALMLLRHPFFTLGLWPGIVLLAVVSTIFFPAWMLLTGGFIAALSTTATRDRLRAAGYLREPSGLL